MALFIARWPDGSAWIVEAASMADVADVLDEVADPGACEVREYTGPFAIELRPTAEPMDGTLLEVRPIDGETHYEMQEALLEAAFPHLRATLEERDPETGLPTSEAWTVALAREHERRLNPSEEWAEGVREWWEEMSGAPADRSAALRDMHGVTIPGEPAIETPAQRELFRQAQRRITDGVVKLLTTPGPTRSAGTRSRAQRKTPGKPRPSSPTRKKR